jgi:hypothetical protein
MTSRWIPALALMTVMAASASGCTIRTGEAARDGHNHNHNKKRPPPAPKKSTPKKSEPKQTTPERKDPINIDRPATDPGYRAANPAVDPSDGKVKWEKLGEGTANGKNDHDVITVGRAEGKFTALRFRVTNSNVKMQDVVVHFADGTKFSPTTRVEFKEGEMSNTIDLPGGKRTIKSVNFRYSDGKGAGNAQVEVWGRN